MEPYAIALLSLAGSVIAAIFAWTQAVRTAKLTTSSAEAIERLKLEADRRRRAVEAATTESQPLEAALDELWSDLQVFKDAVMSLLNGAERNVQLEQLRSTLDRLTSGYRMWVARISENLKATSRSRERPFMDVGREGLAGGTPTYKGITGPTFYDSGGVMTEEDKLSWSQVEYQALRSEILALSGSSRHAVKVFLPLAAAVYAAPYALKRVDDVRLWSICAAVSSLLLFAMTQSLFWSADGTRRIGTYIKEVIEPRTEGTLKWEAVCYALHQRMRWWPGEEFIMAFIPTVANLCAAWVVGAAFLPVESKFTPLRAAAIPATVALWYFHRLARSPHWRKDYTQFVNSIVIAMPGTPAPKLTIKMDQPGAPSVPVVVATAQHMVNKTDLVE